MTIARRYLYEQADRVRLAALVESPDHELAGLAAKIDREEVYHRLHAELWADRLAGEPRFQAAVDELWPYASGCCHPSSTMRSASSSAGPRETACRTHTRGDTHTAELAPLWEEMTEVRRSIPGAQW